MGTAVTCGRTPDAGRRRGARRRWASLLALIMSACLATGSAAAAGPKPSKVTKGEYNSNYNTSKKAASFVSQQITKLQVYAGTCKIVKNLGSQATQRAAMPA